MSDQLKQRTRAFALDTLALCGKLPKKFELQHILSQLLRSSSSVAANYRAAFRGRSPSEFLAKLGIAEEEADESCFWLELLQDSLRKLNVRVEPLIQAELKRLLNEAEQLLRIIVASKKTARSRYLPG